MILRSILLVLLVGDYGSASTAYSSRTVPPGLKVTIEYL